MSTAGKTPHAYSIDDLASTKGSRDSLQISKVSDAGRGRTGQRDLVGRRGYCCIEVGHHQRLHIAVSFGFLRGLGAPVLSRRCSGVR